MCGLHSSLAVQVCFTEISLLPVITLRVYTCQASLIPRPLLMGEGGGGGGGGCTKSKGMS